MILDPSFASLLSQIPEADSYAGFATLLQNATHDVQVNAIEAALRSPMGPNLREQVGKWIVDRYVTTESLVPDEYAQWRLPVRDAMLFVVSQLSEGRLAPKILEQLELPSETTPEERLLRLISKVPGLQKLGQVLARNRHLRPSMRKALTQLENGIHDVNAEEICALIKQQLGPKLKRYNVEIERELLSEASVSAVVRFTWTNPETGERERGVFKTLKPYVPECFAEDMKFLSNLASHFGTRHKEYGFAKGVLTDTFGKVQRLLRHEVRFRGEQKTLAEAGNLYCSLKRVRVPRVIRPLCTSSITALTEEYGTKITDAVRGMSAWRRGQVAEQMIEALVALPLFAPQESALFHADPHAGNLLYNASTGELTILDWALTERLSKEQRRHLALLVFMVGLRDAVGTSEEIRMLTDPIVRRKTKQAHMIQGIVTSYFRGLPATSVPGAVDAMKILQEVAVRGIRFPAPLIMMSKVLFTLDGILGDIAGAGVSMAFTLARHPLRRWVTRGVSADLPLKARDWIAVQCSALLYGGRMSVKLQEVLLDKLTAG